MCPMCLVDHSSPFKQHKLQMLICIHLVHGIRRLQPLTHLIALTARMSETPLKQALV